MYVFYIIKLGNDDELKIQFLNQVNTTFTSCLAFNVTIFTLQCFNNYTR